MGDAEQTLFLAKSLGGASTTDKAQAAACSIDAQTQLVCEGKAIGVATGRPGLDMAPMGAAGDVKTGFSVDANNGLHWTWDEETQKKVPELKKAIMSDPQYKKNPNEAKFGLFKSTFLTADKVQLYFQLGCPGAEQAAGKVMADHQNMGTHGGKHEAVFEGVAKVVAL